MDMVGRAGGFALLGSVPLVLAWLLMCRLAPRLLISSSNPNPNPIALTLA